MQRDGPQGVDSMSPPLEGDEMELITSNTPPSLQQLGKKFLSSFVSNELLSSLIT